MHGVFISCKLKMVIVLSVALQHPRKPCEKVFHFRNGADKQYDATLATCNTLETTEQVRSDHGTLPKVNHWAS